MAPIEPTLFSWKEVESSSDILRLRRTLESLDDAKLIKALTAERKGCRDDYPIVPLWHFLFTAYCKMEYQGFEKDRPALKFRCPAAACGVECHNQAACRSQTKDQKFGRVLRVPLEENPRLFTPLYQHSQAFKDLYKGRTSIERCFFRLDHFYGFEHPQWGGLAKVTARVTMALTAMLATALAWIAAGREDKIRSMFQTAA